MYLLLLCCCVNIVDKFIKFKQTDKLINNDIPRGHCLHICTIYRYEGVLTLPVKHTACVLAKLNFDFAPGRIWLEKLHILWVISTLSLAQARSSLKHQGWHFPVIMFFFTCNRFGAGVEIEFVSNYLTWETSGWRSLPNHKDQERRWQALPQSRPPHGPCPINLLNICFW